MSVSDNDPRPPYAQVAEHLRTTIDRGELTPGQRIPSGRSLAKKYGIALLTVQRAVKMLESEGILVAHPPRGVFVADPNAAAPAEQSPEYTELMSHLDTLQAAFREHQAEVDRRLSALEEEARRRS